MLARVLVPVVIAACMFVVPLPAADLIVDSAAISDESTGENWLAHGRTYSEQRFSPLDEINDANVQTLGLSWFLDLPEERALNATPLVVEGVIYFSGHNSVVTAVDAKAGTVLWRFDPETIRHAGERGKLLWGTNRGVAYWKSKVFVGTGDGRIIAIDAQSGNQVWSTQTVDPSVPYYITGAPRVFNDKVIIGNAGTELGPVRGYVTAYDTETGEQAWRFYTVPGEPAKGFEDEAQAMAAKTWTGEWWEHGGGGTVWNAMTYDPDFNAIYLGTGNGAPWNHKIRSPDGGDNLFLCSIVALDADTGEYRWHYQTTPAESWDYNSAMDMVLADLQLGGRTIKALMHAPKNGFFYVLDRANGNLLSAKPFTKVTWATKVDLKTGRPLEVPGVRYENDDVFIYPGPYGGHSWDPMSYSPITGLVYLPYSEIPGYYSDKGIKRTLWRATKLEFSAGIAVETMFGNDFPTEGTSAGLGGWDPRKGQYVWRVPSAAMGNPGTMTTAGNLVFQGRADGALIAYRADDGALLWRFATGLGISSPPVTYAVDDRQYVALLVGWGGAQAMLGGSIAAQYGWSYGRHPRRLLSFALDGEAVLPPATPPAFAKPLEVADFVIDETLAEKGLSRYVRSCAWCHGPGATAGGGAPDLRASLIVTSRDAFKKVLADGQLVARGMPRFAEFSNEDREELMHFLRKKAHESIAK